MRALALLFASTVSRAAEVPVPVPVPVLVPTTAAIPYGPDPRQVLDFYQAQSDRPTPVLFWIHGGGWVSGARANPGGAAECLAAGISVVSISYRFVTHAIVAGVEPPVEWPLRDAARALQFVRSKAGEWNLDKTRIAASGGSAGACSSLWLAFHDDMADPASEDTVLRESTRLACAAVIGAQTTLDPAQMKEWTPNSRYGGHAFSFMPDPNDNKTRDTMFADFLAAREKILPWIEEYSPYAHVSADDPPVFMIYSDAPAIGQEQRDPTHSANFGVKLRERLTAVGVESELVYPGAPATAHALPHAFIIAKLKK